MCVPHGGKRVPREIVRPENTASPRTDMCQQSDLSGGEKVPPTLEELLWSSEGSFQLPVPGGQPRVSKPAPCTGVDAF